MSKPRFRIQWGPHPYDWTRVFLAVDGGEVELPRCEVEVYLDWSAQRLTLKFDGVEVTTTDAVTVDADPTALPPRPRSAALLPPPDVQAWLDGTGPEPDWGDVPEEDDDDGDGDGE